MTMIRAHSHFLVLGGALAVYVGIDEMQEKTGKKTKTEEKLAQPSSEIETIYNAEAAGYKVRN